MFEQTTVTDEYDTDYDTRVQSLRIVIDAIQHKSVDELLESAKKVYAWLTEKTDKGN